MGPKKGGGAEGDAEDVSVDNLIKFYKKNCSAIGCDVSKQMKTMYETYQEEGDPIAKVSFERKIISGLETFV